MLVRVYWPNCDRFRYDAFWVECTGEESRAIIFPRLSRDQIEESEKLGAGGGVKVGEDNTESPPYCFLVSADLRQIVPFPSVFPWSGQWNAYCPFCGIGEHWVKSLKEVAAIPTPTAKKKRWWKFWDRDKGSTDTGDIV
jgi:hypothetical protein